MRFRIKAMRRPGDIVEAVLEAPGEAEALLMARSQGLHVLSVAGQRAWHPVGARREQPFPLLIFTQQLAMLLRAGLSLMDSLESLSDKEDRLEHRKVLEGVTRALHEGKPLSQALGAAPARSPSSTSRWCARASAPASWPGCSRVTRATRPRSTR